MTLVAITVAFVVASLLLSVCFVLLELRADEFATLEQEQMPRMRRGGLAVVMVYWPTGRASSGRTSRRRSPCHGPTRLPSPRSLMGRPDL